MTHTAQFNTPLINEICGLVAVHLKTSVVFTNIVDITMMLICFLFVNTKMFGFV